MIFHSFPPNLFRIIRDIFLFLTVLAAPGICKAQIAISSGMDDGYAGKVLEKFLKNWPASISAAACKNLVLQIGIDGEGNYNKCIIRKSSGSTSTDKSVCEAIRKASPFGQPPYAQPADISMAFLEIPAATENIAITKNETSPIQQEKSQKKSYPDKYQAYIKKITRELRNSIYIPEKSKPGDYFPTARIKIDSKGKITDYGIIKSSGDKTMDKYVLQGIKRAGKITPSPRDLGNELDITFHLVR